MEASEISRRVEPVLEVQSMNQGPSKFAYLLLFLMTLFSMGGPFVIGKVLGGGEKEGWPPDRPIEWAVAIGIIGGVLVLLTTILVYGLNHKKQLAKWAAEKAARDREVAS